MAQQHKNLISEDLQVQGIDCLLVFGVMFGQISDGQTLVHQVISYLFSHDRLI
jgi:hypothetical protein